MTEEVEEYLEAAEDAAGPVAAAHVMDALGDRLKRADGMGEKLLEMKAAGDALAQLAEQSDAPSKVLSVARDSAGDVAQVSGIGKDRIIDIINSEVGDLEEQAIEAAGGYRVEYGIGMDRFLEEHLEEVVIQRSTDAVDEPVLRWRFDSGERVETADGIHFDHYHLFKKLSAATDRRLVTELASEKAREHSETDVEYAEKSLGPDDRPWSRNNDLWTRAISGLVEERSRIETVLGPRTEAWEHIRARIASGRAVRDLGDAVKHGIIYVPEDLNEIWVPTSLVADAVETVETSRRALQSELAERGIDSDELSGDGISEAVSRGGASARFWRLDAGHDEVPEPETVLDEADDPTERSTGPVDGETDGGEVEKGTETFGREPAEDGSDGGGSE